MIVQTGDSVWFYFNAGPSDMSTLQSRVSKFTTSLTRRNHSIRILETSVVGNIPEYLVRR